VFSIVSNTDKDILIILLGEVNHLLEDVPPFLEEAWIGICFFYDGEWLLAALGRCYFVWHLHL
jgi:hypothetical protein